MKLTDAIELYGQHVSQASQDTLAEMVLYIAGGLECGDFDASHITGANLRALVDKAHSLPDGVALGDAWSFADSIMRGGNHA